MSSRKDGLAVIGFETAEEWEDWLESEHDRCKGIWMKIAKQGTGIASITKAEAVECALCFGWIDGQLDKLDALYWLTRFTPRKPGGRWSEKNTKMAVRLMELGRIRPAGIVEIERAQADGRWDAAYASQGTISVPEDFQVALEQSSAACELFKGLDSANRYAILYRLHHAKDAEKRQRLVSKFVDMLSQGQTIHSRPGKR
jgi:uncharacterized protein YdeI (YjbR/CyaY-like superfamily)